MKIASTLALAVPNVTKPFQAFAPADSAILLGKFSSSRLSNKMLPEGTVLPSAPRAMVFNIDGFSSGNIM